MSDFFTADTHFGHNNIIKYCYRPFNSVQQHDAEMVKRYNEKVTQDDRCFFVGDFSLWSGSKAEQIASVLRKLNGTKVLILGNHDTLKPFTYIDLGFQSVHTSLEHSSGFILVHDPAVAAVAPDRLFLCGHVHTLFSMVGNVINVGVDVHDFRPLSLHDLVVIRRGDSL